MAERYFEGIGRRKRSTARVRVMNGKGAFIVNGKELKDFFTRMGDIEEINGPLDVAGGSSSFDISVMVKGGGVSGQTGAVRMGLARALVKMIPEIDRDMRAGGHLTRDARVKERKKPGLKRARKAPTYTKR